MVEEENGKRHLGDEFDWAGVRCGLGCCCGAAISLSDSGVRFALLDATSNESAYAKGYGEIKGGAG